MKKLPAPLAKIFARMVLLGQWIPLASTKGVALLLAVAIGEERTLGRLATPQTLKRLSKKMQHSIAWEAATNLIADDLIDGAPQNSKGLRRPNETVAWRTFDKITSVLNHTELSDSLYKLLGWARNKNADFQGKLISVVVQNSNEWTAEQKSEFFRHVVWRSRNNGYSNDALPLWMSDRLHHAWANDLNGSARELKSSGFTSSPRSLLSACAGHVSDKTLNDMLRRMSTVDTSDCKDIFSRSSLSVDTLEILVNKGVDLDAAIRMAVGTGFHTGLNDEPTLMEMLQDHNTVAFEAVVQWNGITATRVQREALVAHIQTPPQSTGPRRRM